MTDAQYAELVRLITITVNNQNVLEQKIILLQKDINVLISNQQILGVDQDSLIKDVKTIKSLINK